ncbi:NmrA family NAD(P)-binding protein [Marinoscillum sp.]|uniref:NmrA family NAD(P)-binding protein n=1 Tax=Marinoscillum sp. TaxID=2024838 RepID=UPI003BAD28C0
MKRILITGATGNIGVEVIRYLIRDHQDHTVIAAVRDVEVATKRFVDYPRLSFRQLDMENQTTFEGAFEGIDVLFLLRPPHISDVEKYMVPLLNSARTVGVNKVVFLSVQGAEKSKVIPHNKIERLIRHLAMDYIFVRPSYFMQNLTTTLLSEIVNHQTITLPAGAAKFNWVDVHNIAEVTAILLTDFEKFKNQAFEITGSENKTSGEATELLTEVKGKEFRFRSINPFRFYFMKRKAGVEKGLAIVMTLLHSIPRLQQDPEVSSVYHRLTGKQPTTLREFLERERTTLISG